MNLELTQEQILLVDAFKKLFRKHSTMEYVRQTEMETGFGETLWQQLVEMGVPAARVQPEHNGLGMSLRDLSLILHEAGYHLAPSPIIESVITARILSEVNTPISRDWLEKSKSGGAIITIAARPFGEANSQIIPAGAIADAVIAFHQDTLVLIVDSQCKGPALPNLGSLPLAEWTLGVDPIVLCTGNQALELYESAMLEWRLLLASQMCGISAHALEYAAEYSNEREAFGVKIGTFQGLSHPLADCASANDGSRLLIDYAIWKLEHHHPDAAGHVLMAYWWSAESCANTMPQCVHIFGGYGVSIEHNIQLFARRGMTLASLLGDRNLDLIGIADLIWGGKTSATPAAGQNSIDFDLGVRADEARSRAEAFFDRYLTAEYEKHRGHSWDTYHPEIYSKLAEENLLFPEWPRSWGGMEATPAEQFALTQVFFERRWTQYPQATTRIVGEMIIKFGSEELKEEVLPKIMKGQAICCLGLTEPHCGSDVFAAKTKAVKEGDKWTINGQKMFTSGANIGQYVMLLTNTDPSAPKHIGKTLFIVPMNSPGVDVHRVDTISDDRTNITYYTDVVIPDKYRLGKVNAGSEVMSYMLTLEQGGIPSGFEFKHMVDQAIEWARSNLRAGKPAIDDSLVKVRLATAFTHLTIANAMLLRITEQREKGKQVRHYGSMLKAFVCEAWKKNGADLMNMAAPHSLISNTPNLGYLEGGWRSSLASAIYGGSTQVHRSVVAERALGMPRSRLG